MSWMTKLYETYDHAVQQEQSGNDKLWPISHFVKNAHIEVVIDSDGNFIKGRTKILHGSESPTLIPATEASAGRSGAKIAPHPLCEELSYCALDLPEAKKEKVKAYMDQLGQWAGSSLSHPKVKAIFKYLSKRTLWQELSSEIEFPLRVKKENGTSQKISAEKVFIRWCVEEPGNPVRETWLDKDLISLWTAYDAEKNSNEDFCFIQGGDARIASNHPRFLRWPGDGAKLVSSNDSSGFTFRGKFTDKHGVQAAEVGFEVTQKAHNALRWLIANQGFRNGDQVYVTWAVSGKSVPAPLEDPWAVLEDAISFKKEHAKSQIDAIDHGIDIGQSFAQKFNEYLRGYGSKLDPNEQIVVIGLDAATPGRMGIIYYRELLASEFLKRLESWHAQFSWFQRHILKTSNREKTSSKVIWPICSPAPKNIAEAAYGNILKSDTKNKLRKKLVERILPCIVEGRPFPEDLLRSAVRRASNRNNCDHWEWERNLGITCALYKGFYLRQSNNKRREYSMSLEEERTERDYLYGRLLAVAERIEEIALSVGGENRPTTAARLMQRFADRPFSTWRNIELGLQPYMQRLQSSRPGFLTNQKKELDRILSAFQPDDFTSEKSLTGEFLLGYHCQRMALRNSNSAASLENQI